MTKTFEISTPWVRTFIDFPAKDAKGRTIGAQIIRSESDFVAVSDEEARSCFYCHKKPGHYFCFRPHATRNGLAFGALQSTKYFETAEEREAAIEAYLIGARKRAAK